MNSGTEQAYQEIVETEFPAFVNLLEHHMNFEQWGFKQSFYGVSGEFAPSVIYESERCRIRWMWLPTDPRDGHPTLSIRYGRLHASNDHRFMTWKGMNCHCWHSVDAILYFLDGLSPAEAAVNKFKIPPVKKQFREVSEKRDWPPVEWAIRQESFIWQHYGNRLFNLFDLQHSDLWEQYKFFIKELYRLDPDVFNPAAPPPENIC